MTKGCSETIKQSVTINSKIAFDWIGEKNTQKNVFGNFISNIKKKKSMEIELTLKLNFEQMILYNDSRHKTLYSVIAECLL